MKTSTLKWALLIALFTFAFGNTQAAKVIMVRNTVGVPFTKAYMKQQAVKTARSTQFSDGVVVILLPQNVTGYDHWQIDFSGSGGSYSYEVDYNTTTYYSPSFNVTPGSYDFTLSCYNYYPQGFYVDASWTDYDDNNNFRYHDVIDSQHEGYYTPVYLPGVGVIDTSINPDFTTTIQIDGKD